MERKAKKPCCVHRSFENPSQLCTEQSLELRAARESSPANESFWLSSKRQWCVWANSSIHYHFILPNSFSNNIYGCCFCREGENRDIYIYIYIQSTSGLSFTSSPHFICITTPESVIGFCNTWGSEAPGCISAEDFSISRIAVIGNEPGDTTRYTRDHQAQGYPF